MADPTNALGLDPQTMALFQAPQQSGLAKFFGNPLTQAALATYFGAISSPKERGLGGAIGQGGLAGLGAYQQAAQMQANLPLRQAQRVQAMAGTGKDIAQAGEARSHGQLFQHQAEAYAPNADEAIQWEHLKKDPRFTDPISQQVLSELSAGAQNGTMTLQGRMNAFTALNQGNQKAALNAINIEKAKADINLMGQKAVTEAMRPGEIRAHEAAMGTEAGAAAARANVETELEPARKELYGAEATRAERGPVAPEVTEYGIGDPTKSRRTRLETPDTGYTFTKPSTPAKPPNATALAHTGLENLEKAESLRPKRLTTRVSEYVTGDRTAQYKYAMSKGLSPKTGKVLPPLPPGATWSDPLDDGTPTAIHADGKRYPLME